MNKIFYSFELGQIHNRLVFKTQQSLNIYFTYTCIGKVNVLAFH